MQPGKILVAQHEGTFVIKLVGDVRLTLCTTIDDYLNKMFINPEFVGVIVDLSDAEGIDSTTLGLLAKMAVQGQQMHHLLPIILSPNPNITRLLASMGFDKIFDVRSKMSSQGPGALGELPVIESDEACIREKIIEAHRVLMSLNEENQETFSALVNTLESSRSG